MLFFVYIEFDLSIFDSLIFSIFKKDRFNLFQDRIDLSITKTIDSIKYYFSYDFDSFPPFLCKKIESPLSIFDLF